MSNSNEMKGTSLMGLFSPPQKDDNENGGAQTDTEAAPTKGAVPVSDSQDDQGPRS